jgi:hypothetical protein
MMRLALLLSFTVLAGSAQADLYTFGGASSIQMNVDSGGAGQVTFTFTNQALTGYSVTDIYFDAGSILGFSGGAKSDVGASFDQFALPAELPNADDYGFKTSPGLSFDSAPENRIDSGLSLGQSMSVTFDLNSGGGLDEVVDAIDSGDLRVGIYVQGMHKGEVTGNSYLNASSPDGPPADQPAHAPLPGAYVLGAIGLGCVGYFRRRFA